MYKCGQHAGNKLFTQNITFFGLYNFNVLPNLQYCSLILLIRLRQRATVSNIARNDRNRVPLHAVSDKVKQACSISAPFSVYYIGL